MTTKLKEGYTLIEVLMVVGVSLSLLLTLHYIPLRMTESFKGYTSEVSTNRNNYHLASAIHADLKKYSNIEETSDGFKIGEAIYVFNTEGVFRTLNESTLEIVDEGLIVQFIDGLVKIESIEAQSKRDSRKSYVDLVFPVDTLPKRVKGGV